MVGSSGILSVLNLFLAAGTLSSCATLLAGNYADVDIHGYNGPLSARDTAGNPYRVIHERVDDKIVNILELDKRQRSHTVIVSNGAQSSRHHLERSINWGWLLPNYLTWEIGFLVDIGTKAVYDFPDIYVGFRPLTSSRDSLLATIKPPMKTFFHVAIGIAMPVYQPPQGPGLAGFSVTPKLTENVAIGVDASIAGTSTPWQGPGTIYKTISNVGPSVTFIYRNTVLLFLLPAYQHVRFSEYRGFAEDAFLGSRNFFTVGAGLGVRTSGGFAIDLRLFPSFYSKQVSSRGYHNAGHMQLRFGYCGEVVLFR